MNHTALLDEPRSQPEAGGSPNSRVSAEGVGRDWGNQQGMPEAGHGGESLGRGVA